MIGILLIYFIWKHYSDLALRHKKNKWGYGFLGIITYYLGTIIFGAIIGLINYSNGTQYFEDSNNITLSLLALPFGLLCVWGLYKLLEKNWKNEKILNSDTLDHDLIENNNNN